MLIPLRINFRRAVLLVCTSCLIACAGYPDDPKTPNAVDDRYTIEEDGFLSVPKEEGILINDTAGEGTEITLISVDELETTEKGRLILVEDGSFTYQPAANFHGTDQATYIIKNNKGKTAAGTIHFNVISHNDAPSISPISDQTTTENRAVEIDFSVTDGDTDPADLVITPESDNRMLVPNHAMTIETNGENCTLSVVPEEEQYGSATITITVSDGILTAQTAFVLTVTQTNSPPTIAPIEDQITDWRTPITFPITIGDAETPADQLELNGYSTNPEIVSDENITFDGMGTDRTVTIRPNRYEAGRLSIYITVTDGGDSDGNEPLSYVENFDLTVESPFRPSLFQPAPAAVKNSASQDQNLSPLGEATAGHSVRMTATDILLAFHNGEITVNADGRITYSPRADFSSEEFVLDLSSGCEPQETCRRRFFSEIYRLPAVEPDHYVTPAMHILQLSSADGLLANDRDPAGLELTVAEPGLFDTLFGGTVRLWPDGGFSYEPPLNYQGSDGFAYSVTNGVDSVMGIAIISITP